MSVDTNISADTRGWLVRLFGPTAVDDLSRPLTDQERADVEAGLAKHGGDPVAAMGVSVDADTAAIIRSLPVGGRR